jgi:AcrR family transcriptional regulator
MAARKRLRAEDRRQQILDVATPLFTEFGADAVSTTEIARRAGVTQPVLYRHFASKDDLYAHAVLTPMREHLDALVGGIRQAVAQEPDPVSRLRRIEEHWVFTMVKAGPFLGVVMSTNRETASEHYQATIVPCLQEICDLLREHVLPPETTGEAAWRFVRAMLGMNLLIVFDAMHREAKPDFASLAQDLSLLLGEGQSGL